MTNFFLIRSELLLLRRSIADPIDLDRLDKAIAEIDRAVLMEQEKAQEVQFNADYVARTERRYSDLCDEFNAFRQERVRQMGEKESVILHLTRALTCYINSNSIG